MVSKAVQEMKHLKDAAKRAGKKSKEEYKAKEAELLKTHQLELEHLQEPASAMADIAENGAHENDQHDDTSEFDAAERKKSKAARRREKQAQQEAAKEATIAEEVANIGETDREAEEKALEAKLVQLGLRIVDIPADGNCMYRAVAHQCELRKQPHLIDNKDALSAYQVLRDKAAAHIREHSGDFEPFILDTDRDASAEDQMAAWLEGVTGLEWGTQVELQALAASLRIHIQVVSARLPVVNLGEEHKAIDKPSLQVCYLQYALGSGEHYNSVAPTDASVEDQSASQLHRVVTITAE